MLYPKNSSSLKDEDFRNPSSEYKAAPFWAWNTKLDKEELIRQIEVFKEMGFGGVHIHVRIGMATEYLGNEFMDIVTACVEKAHQEKMHIWLYDEDRWPSGAAGGIVTKNNDYRIKHLLLTRHPYGVAVDMPIQRWSRVFFGRTENGELLTCFDVILDNNGNLVSYKKINENSTPRGFKLYAYIETAESTPWYNNQAYVDILNPEAIKEFIKITHERYAKRLQKYFGNVIPAIFTDEPQFAQGTLLHALDSCDVTLPWTRDIPVTYSNAYNGEDLIAGLPELIWELADEKVSIIRYRFHNHITELLVSAFFDQCGQWCEEHNLLFTGHMMAEPSLDGQTYAVGEVMRSYRSFGLPGIDLLCDAREFTTAKQAQSSARQYGRAGVLSELYGVTNWDFDFRSQKLQGDWQAALGISVRVPHLSWVSMNGEAKRDYPGTFSYQAPWHKEYPYIENHFARLATVLTRGKAVCRIGVIHPIESYWLRWGPSKNTETVRKSMDEKFITLCDWLLRSLIDFDYICESTLPEQSNISVIEKKFPVGKMTYDAIIICGMETMRSTTIEYLEKFHNMDGKLIFAGTPPTLIDAVPNEKIKKLCGKSTRCAFDRQAILNTLEEFRTVQIYEGNGAQSHRFLYQMREERNLDNYLENQWLFICHADKEANKDTPHSDDYRIQIRGEWELTEYSTVNGTKNNLQAEILDGWTILKAKLWDHDSILIKLTQHTRLIKIAHTDGFSAISKPAVKKSSIDTPVRFLDPVPVTLHEPNVLLLDIAEFALNNEDWRDREEILRIDNTLRKELGWLLRGDSVAQPWVECDTSAPHILRLRYKFKSEIPIMNAELALENAEITEVMINDKAADKVYGWYVDKSIGKVRLPEIKAGINTLELKMPFGKNVNVESCYLLGDFSVKVHGIHCTLGSPVKTLAFGDITRQGLPFYGGNLTYHLEVESLATPSYSTIHIEASSYRFMLLRASLDGIDQGVIATAPYRLSMKCSTPGKHKIDLTGFGCRVNTFGQLHNNQDRGKFWWGPNSWRTTESAWTYEYRFWAQGVLKSPEIWSE
ncbi:MAG: hypothetical protein FWC97_00030 [Treponema sp.]|nr:hypothetical protein [Treponema sp.]